MSPKLNSFPKLPGILGELDRMYIDEKAQSRLTHYLAEMKVSDLPREAITDRVVFLKSTYSATHPKIKGGVLTEEGLLLATILLIANHLEQRDILHYPTYQLRIFGDDFADYVEVPSSNRTSFTPKSYRRGITHDEIMDIKEVTETITNLQKTEAMLEAVQNRQSVETYLALLDKTLVEIFPEELV